MGRKIPAKKHRGVKDPVKQQAQRFQSIKDKINAPPTDPDEQPVPRSLLRLFAFQQPRAPDAKKKPKRPLADRAGGGGGSAVAALRRLPGEAGRAFSLRINSAVRALSHPDDQDYPLDLEETDTRGEYIAAQRERRQRKHRKALAAEARAAARAAGGEGGGAGGERGAAGGGQGGERLRKPQRRALKKKEQLKAKEEEAAAARALAARELRYERVAFGDVAHAPPALPAPRRATAGDQAPRVRHALCWRAAAAAARALAARELRYGRVAFGDVAHAPPALPAPRRATAGDQAPRVRHALCWRAAAAAARALAARELRYERVAFGDVAHAPPALPAPRRATAGDQAPRVRHALCWRAAAAAARALAARELRYERVAFGDVAHAPPALPAPRRATAGDQAPRVRHALCWRAAAAAARALAARELRYGRVAFGDVAHAPPALPAPRRATAGDQAPRVRHALCWRAAAAAARALAARELRYERVAFGDVAHAPPALPAPRRATAGDQAPRVRHALCWRAAAAAARALAARELRYERVAFGDVAHAPPALPAPRRATAGDQAPRVRHALCWRAAAAAARALAARELRYERVAFGDVAHAPPALPAPRRATAGDQAPRPGRRDLLLTSMLKGGGGNVAASPGGAARGGAGAAAGAAGAAGAAERERRERARLAAVAAYRALKKQRAAQPRAAT